MAVAGDGQIPEAAADHRAGNCRGLTRLQQKNRGRALKNPGRDKFTFWSLIQISGARNACD